MNDPFPVYTYKLEHKLAHEKKFSTNLGQFGALKLIFGEGMFSRHLLDVRLRCLGP